MDKVSRIGVADHLRSLSDWHNNIMVFNDPKMVYMKNGRTGGTSMLQALIRQRHLLTKKERGEWIQNITDEELEEYLIFSFVRNPWDRIISVAEYFGGWELEKIVMGGNK